MEIKFVKRSAISTAKKRVSKFKPLLEALDKLKPGGSAIEVSYTDERNVNSMRTAVYHYGKQKSMAIRSRKDSKNNKIYFFRD